MRWLALLLCLASSCFAADLAWDWIQEEGGSADGFRIYYGSASGQYTESVDVGLVNQWHVPDAWPNGTYFFVVSAYNASGASPYSNEAVYVCDIVSGIQPASGGNYQLSWVEDSLMTTIGPIFIAANGDDGNIYNGSLYPNGDDGSNAWIGGDSAYYQWGFFRFTLSAAIPSGATINAGTKIALYGVDSYSWGTGDYLTIYATNSSDASQPSTGGEPTPLTTASVRWPASGDLTWPTGQYNERDIVSIIQELVDDYGGLSSGAHILIWIRGEKSNSWLAAEDYNSSNNNLAKLTIEYTTSGGSASAVPKIFRQFAARRK